jgi:hypothetical protein
MNTAFAAVIRKKKASFLSLKDKEEFAPIGKNACTRHAPRLSAFRPGNIKLSKGQPAGLGTGHITILYVSLAVLLENPDKQD